MAVGNIFSWLYLSFAFEMLFRAVVSVWKGDSAKNFKEFLKEDLKAKEHKEKLKKEDNPESSTRIHDHLQKAATRIKDRIRNSRLHSELDGLASVQRKVTFEDPKEENQPRWMSDPFVRDGLSRVDTFKEDGATRVTSYYNDNGKLIYQKEKRETLTSPAKNDADKVKAGDDMSNPHFYISPQQPKPLEENIERKVESTFNTLVGDINKLAGIPVAATKTIDDEINQTFKEVFDTFKF